MNGNLLYRIKAALQAAERWTAKYIADNDDERVDPSPTLHAAKSALREIGAVYSEIGRLPR